MEKKIVYTKLHHYHIAIDGRTLCGRDASHWWDSTLPAIDGDTVTFCPRCGKKEEFDALLEARWQKDQADTIARRQQVVEATARRIARQHLGDELKQEVFAALAVDGRINPTTGFATFRMEHGGESFEVEIRVR